MRARGKMASSQIPEQFRPQKSFSFPKRTFGKKAEERSFRAEWCTSYQWLHYDVKLDAAFCYLCMTASHEGKFLASTRRDPAFVSKGFTYWKEATTAFKKHQASDCHREATEALVILPVQVGDVGELLSREHQEEKATNRRMLLKILQSIRFLARQGMPLRSGGGDSESNLMQLLQLQCVECPELGVWLSKKTNKYTSHDIQNECLKIMALQILKKVCKNIQDSGCYSIMADECTDISNQEQFTICIRSVGEDLQDHEDFIGLYEVAGIDADCLVQAIKDTLLRINVPLSQCRGQCYDGASNMRGSRNGVATQIAKEEKRALYTHCFGHALNLAVADTLKHSKVCRDAMETAFEITKLIKFSPKRNAAFDRIKAESKEEEPVSGVGIRTFCHTRWTVRGNAIESILENYQVLNQLWEECLETRLDPDVKGRIIGVQSQMACYNLLFGLKLSERVLKITDNLSKTLQTQSLSAAESHGLAEMTCTTLKRMRSDEAFKLFFGRVEALRIQAGIEEAKLPRKRRAPKQLEVGDGDCYHSPTVEEHYRRQYYEALDLAVSSISDRFDQPGYAVYQKLETLLLKAASRQDFSAELKEVISVYGDDFDEKELLTQLEMFCTNFHDDVSNIHSILKFFQGLSAGQRVFFKQVCFLVRLVLVMPATNATSERSFSVMRRLKSYLRSTMSQPRLNHLMVLSIYKQLLDELDLNTTAKEFVGSSEHRLRVFGTFGV